MRVGEMRGVTESEVIWRLTFDRLVTGCSCSLLLLHSFFLQPADKPLIIYSNFSSNQTTNDSCGIQALCRAGVSSLIFFQEAKKSSAGFRALRAWLISNIFSKRSRDTPTSGFSPLKVSAEAPQQRRMRGNGGSPVNCGHSTFCMMTQWATHHADPSDMSGILRHTHRAQSSQSFFKSVPSKCPLWLPNLIKCAWRARFTTQSAWWAWTCLHTNSL